MLNGQHAHSRVFQDFGPDTAETHREHWSPEIVAHNANQQFRAAGAHRTDQDALNFSIRLPGPHTCQHSSELLTHSLLTSQIERNTAHIALMEQRWRLNLENHRQAEFARGLSGLIC